VLGYKIWGYLWFTKEGGKAPINDKTVYILSFDSRVIDGIGAGLKMKA